MTGERRRVFSVCDARYFPGFVALLNSLHLTGNHLPVTVLDVGLTGAQRRRLDPHCEIVDGHGDRHPYLAKLVAPLASSADVVVLIDSDVIVTSPLDEPLAAAEGGSVFAFPDPVGEWRFFSQWHDLLGLRAPLRPERYVNVGFVAWSRAALPGLIERWAELCELLVERGLRPDAADTADRRLDPLWLPEQDALNALLMSELPPGTVALGSPLAAPMVPADLQATRVGDVDRLRCVRAGQPVTLLHAIGLRKPWQREAARELRATAYTRLLRRVLTGDDLLVRLADHELAPWLRPGATATGVRWVLHAYEPPARWTRPARHALAARRRPG